MQIDIATDSLNVVRTLNKIIMDHNFTPAKPWGLLDNGDLWAVIQILIQARRSNLTANVSVRKVKGHATPIDVQKGVISSEDAWGNDSADALATTGKKAHHHNLHTYAQFFVIKHTMYFRALQALYKHIGLCMELDSEIRSDTKGEDSSPAQGQHPGLVPRLPSGAYQPLTKGISPRPPTHTLLCSTNKNFEHVWVFLNWLLVQPLPPPPPARTVL